MCGAGPIVKLPKVPQVVCELVVARSQGVTKVERVGFTSLTQIQIFPSGKRLNTRKMAPTCRLHGRKAQHKNNGSCPFSSHPEGTQNILSLYVSGTF